MKHYIIVLLSLVVFHVEAKVYFLEPSVKPLGKICIVFGHHHVKAPLEDVIDIIAASAQKAWLALGTEVVVSKQDRDILLCTDVLLAKVPTAIPLLLEMVVKPKAFFNQSQHSWSASDREDDLLKVHTKALFCPGSAQHDPQSYHKIFCKTNFSIFASTNIPQQQVAVLEQGLERLPLCHPVALKESQDISPWFVGKQLHLIAASAALNVSEQVPVDVRMILPAPFYGNENYPASFVVNEWVVGSGFHSRLTQALREERGLVYEVSSELHPELSPSAWYIDFKPNLVDLPLVWNIVQKVLSDMPKNVPGLQELEIMKNFVKKKLRLHYAYPLDRLLQGLHAQRLGLGLDFFNELPRKVDALTPQALQQAFKAMLRLDTMAVLVLGPVDLLQKSWPAPTDFSLVRVHKASIKRF